LCKFSSNLMHFARNFQFPLHYTQILALFILQATSKNSILENRIKHCLQIP
jgi:hypothetical protein